MRAGPPASTPAVAPGATRLSVCIVQPGTAEVSETFLRAQAERLPARVTVIDGFPPRIDGTPIWNGSAPARAARKLWRLASRSSHQDEVTAAFVAAFRRVRPAVVLAQYGPTGVAVREACERLRIPLVVHFHGFDASRHDVLNEHRRTYPQLFQSAEAIVVVSQPMAARLIGLGAEAGKVHQNPCGVDVDLFRGAGPGTAPPTLVSAGRFVDKKAPLVTIAAFAAAAARLPQARLRMIGDGPLLPSCRSLVQRFGLSGSVEFLGSQPAATVCHEMAMARAFVQHSVEAPSGDSEGMPVSILEAAASGLPVISTRHAGIPEAVIDQVTGILVDEGDEAGMAQAMTALLNDPARAAEMGRLARDHVTRHFAMNDSIRRLSRILFDAAGHTRSQSLLRTKHAEAV